MKGIKATAITMSGSASARSKPKTALRTAKARTREAPDHAIAQALATITASNARSWFRHCDFTLL
jgi:hypothetical protein